MKTWEMIKELTENPEKEFTRKSDGLHIKTNEYGELVWDSGYQFLRLHHDWKEIKKPVDFMTAIKSGKHVGVEYSGARYREMSLPNLFYELQQDYSDKTIRQMILHGKWYIECQEGKE
jgi:hypothetical protein